MKLSHKFTLAFLAVFSLVLAVNSYLRVQREMLAFETDMRRDHELIGRDLAVAVARIWQLAGKEAALDFIAEANRTGGQILIRWTRLDAPPDSPGHPAIDADAMTRIQLGDGVGWTIWEGAGTRHLYTYIPVVVGGDAVGHLEFCESLAQHEHYVRTSIKRAVVASLVVFAGSGVVSLLLGVWIVGHPVRRLIDKAREVASGQLGHHLDVRQKDEIGQLAEALNDMSDRLADAQKRLAEETAARIASLDQLRHAERLTTVGQLASGVAHELGTPLNVVSARAKMIADDNKTDTETAHHARIIHQQAERMTRIIRQLLSFARPRKPCPARIDVGVVARNTISLLSAMARGKRITLSVSDTEGPVYAQGDADQLEQVLSNLVLNAIQATPEGGAVVLDCRDELVKAPAEHGGAEGEYACVRVTDQGPGIAPEDCARIFEPFFTTKDVGKGTGLGLSVSLGIVREHGGWIAVRSEAGRGSCFAVYLPKEASHEKPSAGG